MQIICTDLKIGYTFILWEDDIQNNFILVVKKEAWCVGGGTVGIARKDTHSNFILHCVEKTAFYKMLKAICKQHVFEIQRHLYFLSNGIWAVS